MNQQNEPETPNTSQGAMYLTHLPRTITLVGFFIVLALIFWHTSAVWLLAFVAVLVAVLLRSLAQPLEKHMSMSSGGALAMVIIVLVGLLGLAGYFFAPQLGEQIGELFMQVPEAVRDVRDNLDQYRWAQPILERFSMESMENGESNVSIIPRVTGTFTTLLDILTNTLFVIFVGIFLAANPKLYRRGVLKIIPPEHRKRGEDILKDIIDTLRNWLLGRFVSMIVIGIVSTIGLLIIGVPLALSLGLLTGLLEFIPVIGPFLAAAPALLLAFSNDPGQVVWVIVLYIVIEQLEGNLLVPLVQKRTVSLPPAITLIAIFAFGLLFGFLGLLVATPVAAILMVLVRQLYVQDQQEKSDYDQQGNVKTPQQSKQSKRSQANASVPASD